jgi:ATP-dependent protease ClpP protease subunit
MLTPALNRMLWIVALLAIGVLSFQFRDNLDAIFAGVGKLEVREVAADDAVMMRWSGRIDAPFAGQLTDAFDAYRRTRRNFVLSISSPGGSVSHGAEVVRVLKRIAQNHRLETVVEARDRCASMCVPIYLQGQARTAAAGARFMFHEVRFKEQFSRDEIEVSAEARGAATDRFFNTFFKPAGVPEPWIRQVRADMAGGKDIWKTARQLVDENAGIVQTTF